MSAPPVKVLQRIAPPSPTKRARLEQILAAVYEEGATTRASLTERLGWPVPTVTRLTTELREHGLLRELPGDAYGERGRPSRRLTLAPERGLALGLELAPDAMRWTLVGSDGVVLEDGAGPVDELRPSTDTLDGAVATVRSELAARGRPWDRVRALTVAPHGYVTSEGVWEQHDGPSVSAVPVRGHLEATTGLRVVAEDVARAFAVAERRADPDPAFDALYVLVGVRSLGSGLFADGRLLRTRLGVCGELGHVVVVPGGELCDCGRRGCLSRYAGADALRARDPLGAATLGDLCARARAGEVAAREALLQAVPLLSRGLATAIAVAGTPTIVLGGEFADAGPDFLGALSAALRAEVVPSLAPHVAVRYATQGRHSASRGAALLALDAFWSHPDLRTL